MPIILKIEHTDSQRTAIWEIKEDEHTLLEMAALHKTDLATFTLIKNPERRLEWLAVRALLKEFYPSQQLIINYHENGRPFLINHTDKISISHSGKMIGIILHPTQNPGIDIEMIHPRIFKIADRFLNELEKTYIGTEPRIEQLTIIWGAKEVMFKVYEHGGISFKNDFTIKPFPVSLSGYLTGVITKDNNLITIPMEYKKIGNFILVQTNYIIRNFEKNENFDIL